MFSGGLTRYAVSNCLLNYSLSFSSASISIISWVLALSCLCLFGYFRIGSMFTSCVLALPCTTISWGHCSTRAQIDRASSVTGRSSYEGRVSDRMLLCLLIASIASLYFALLFDVFICHFRSISFLAPQWTCFYSLSIHASLLTLLCRYFIIFVFSYGTQLFIIVIWSRIFSKIACMSCLNGTCIFKTILIQLIFISRFFIDTHWTN